MSKNLTHERLRSELLIRRQNLKTYHAHEEQFFGHTAKKERAKSINYLI